MPSNQKNVAGLMVVSSLYHFHTYKTNNMTIPMWFKEIYLLLIKHFQI